MTTRADVVSGRLVYTCNCGWVDNGHVGSSDKAYSDPVVGAYNLWQQLQKEGYKAEDTIMNQPCFRVIYRQKQGKLGFKDVTGETRAFLVRKGLSEARKKEIALSIFLVVTDAFEAMQGMWIFGGVPGANSWASSYSQEDIISNVIGFYAVVNKLSADNIMSTICQSVGRDESLQMYDTHFPDGIGAVKNKIQNYNKPIYYPSTKCTGSTSQLPDLLNNITPATYGSDFIIYKQEYAVERVKNWCVEHPIQKWIMPMPNNRPYRELPTKLNFFVSENKIYAEQKGAPTLCYGL